MEALIEKVREIRQKAQQYKSEVCQLLSIPLGASDPRRNCFSMLFNHTTLTLELLGFYKDIVIKLPVGVSEERIQKQNAERCVKILKWMFVASLSSIEYSAKASVAYYGADSPAEGLLKVNKGQFIYLGKIMRNSNDSSLIDNSECEDWKNLIFMRNCIVHNNAVSDENRSIDIGGTTIVASVGKMMQGKLDDFAIFTEVAIERYFAWVKALIKEYGK